MAADHAHDAHDYHRGEMEIHEQSSTFALFINLTKWSSLLLAVSLVFLTLMFCTEAGFLGSLICAAITMAVGVWMFRDKGGAH